MIRKARTITGRVVGPRTVELDEVVGQPGDRVRLTVETEQTATPPSDADTFSNFIRSLPPGHRSKADIDAQIAEERAAWGD